MMPPFPYDFIDEVIIPEEEIKKRVTELGHQIAQDYHSSHNLILIGLLRGSFVFLTDLSRSIGIPLTVDFMATMSYEGAMSTGAVKLILDHKINIEGWDVILVDDIIDTGYTVDVVSRLLATRNPHSLKICALLDKVERHRVDIQIDYCGFVIPDRFVVGYGLDIDEQGRHLPYIATVNLAKYNRPNYRLHH
ncbi:MAG: hypoxanthine phosphoribosyltransferase [Anaerolineae bacterium]|nr:hypoxanthine phosphoribosyltransferase [Anaerolineae bacterium]